MKETRRALAVLLNKKDIPEAAWRQALLPLGPGLGLTNLVEMSPFMAYASFLEALFRLSAIQFRTIHKP